MRAPMLGQIIYGWRKYNEIPTSELAEQLDIEPHELIRLERGKTVSYRVLAMIFCWMLNK